MHLEWFVKGFIEKHSVRNLLQSIIKTIHNVPPNNISKVTETKIKLKLGFNLNLTVILRMSFKDLSRTWVSHEILATAHEKRRLQIFWAPRLKGWQRHLGSFGKRLQRGLWLDLSRKNNYYPPGD